MDEKKWWESRTIWGAIIAVVCFGLTFFGITIAEPEQTQIIDLILQIATPVGALVALILTIVGRVKATKVIKK